MNIFGVGCAFLNVVADQLLPLLDAHTFLASECGTADDSPDHISCRVRLVSLYALVVLFPLCLVRNINSFVWTSYFAIMAICYSSAIVIKYSVNSMHEHGQNSSIEMVSSDPSGIWKAIPIICFSFNCHLAYVPIFQELRQVRGAKGVRGARRSAQAIYFSGVRALRELRARRAGFHPVSR